MKPRLKYLLDTHALAWALFDQQQLSNGARAILREESGVLFSPISLFEIETKAAIGKCPGACPATGSRRDAGWLFKRLQSSGGTRSKPAACRFIIAILGIGC